VYGFVGVDYCGTALPSDKVEEIAGQLCKATEKIQFKLQFRKIL